MNHLEIEFKSLLTQDEFNKLLPLFSAVQPVSQTNHYFDTADWQLRHQRSSLRIRTFADAAELTLKISQEVGNMEYNQTLTLAEANAVLTGSPLPDGQIAQLLVNQGIDLSSLHLLGSLTTIRHEMQHDIGLLALDESHYFDITDYELEVEVEEASTGEQDFFHFLKEQGIDYKFAKSKIARFAQNL